MDINREPERSYMPEKRAQLERLRAKRKAKFGRLATLVAIPPPPLGTEGASQFIPSLLSPVQDDTRSTYSDMTSASQGSRGPAILQKLKNNKSKQKSRIEAVETVVN